MTGGLEVSLPNSCLIIISIDLKYEVVTRTKVMSAGLGPQQTVTSITHDNDNHKIQDGVYP